MEQGIGEFSGLSDGRKAERLTGLLGVALPISFAQSAYHSNCVLPHVTPSYIV
jgi:hypothetical protein